MAGGFGGQGGNKMRFAREEDKEIKITKEILLRIVKYFKPFWKQLLLAITLLFIVSLLGLIPPIMTKNIIDKALPQRSMYLLIMFILACIGATVLKELVSVWQNYINTWISKHIIYNMKNEMYKHLQHMSMNFFSLSKPGEIITRMTSDIEGIQDIFKTTVVNALSSILTILTTMVLLLSMNFKLAIISMIILPVFILPTRKVGKYRWKVALDSQKMLGELNQLVQETLSISGSTLMKIFTKEKEAYNQFESTNKRVINLQIKESLAGRWFFMTMSIFITLGPMIIYLYGGYLFMQDKMSIGEIVAFVALLDRLYRPVTQLSNIHIDVTRSLALFQRIFDYFDMEEEKSDKIDAKNLENIEGYIEFDNVSFSYKKGLEVLHNINFSIGPDTMTALVGASGVGKTTVTNLIPRLYEVSKGSIKIDGIDISDIKRQSLRSQIGIVMQEPYLFNDTIEANLRYGREDATDEEIIEACKSAYIHDFIMSLPEKYNTIVGNRGIKLSGGEKQRISIARVILKNPKILILDEATSSLDSVSEMYIQKALVPLLKGRASIVIAHRLSTILSADNILVFEDGKIVQNGKHENLLEEGGLYKKLYDTQFRKA
ncbi:ABC transporter ATP-binding protein [Clostridium sp.]|uniref:ABC transporter ATP-binding protein n=1 Tax=Clostridium sp. TaxID=1506 RepID=UPI0025C2C0E0|nr:ABC transporter ATP-binding protein [Clostridium sp.]